MEKLFIVFDPHCDFCRRCRRWMEQQPSYFDLVFVAARSPEARKQLPGIEEYESFNDLLVVTEAGAVYQGSPAFIMCLYALVDFREWSQRLASPALLPFARAMFEMISKNRFTFAKWLGETGDAEMANLLRRYPSPDCGNTHTCSRDPQ